MRHHTGHRADELHGDVRGRVARHGDDGVCPERFGHGHGGHRVRNGDGDFGRYGSAVRVLGKRMGENNLRRKRTTKVKNKKLKRKKKRNEEAGD